VILVEEFMDCFHILPLFGSLLPKVWSARQARSLPKFDEHASMSLSGSGEELFFILVVESYARISGHYVCMSQGQKWVSG